MQKNFCCCLQLLRETICWGTVSAKNYFKRLVTQFRREPNNEPEENYITSEPMEMEKIVSLRQIASELDHYTSFKYHLHQNTTGFYRIKCSQTMIFWVKFYFQTTSKYNFQERFVFYVWIGATIIGPLILEGLLNGTKYSGFLQNEVEGFFRRGALYIFVFHNSRIVYKWLSSTKIRRKRNFD